MSDNRGGQWYTNKELFEQIIGLQDEMRETRSIISQYNGLYDKVHNVEKRLQTIESETTGQEKFKKGLRLWSGWIISFLTFIVLLIERFFL